MSRHLPATVLKMMRLLPPRVNTRRSRPIPRRRARATVDHHPADAPDGERRATVALFTGCIGGVLFPSVQRQAIALLQRAGCDVLVPASQVCCGAIHHHNGHLEQAAQFARDNLEAFPTDRGATRPVDFVVNHIAGCGAMLKGYAQLLSNDPNHAERASHFAGRVRDISELLVELKAPPPAHRVSDQTITYHDACHLVHAQQLIEQPRQLLAQIQGLQLVPLPESDLCCGAAGSYNLTQPEMASRLGQRKVRRIQETGASLCVTGNFGCAMQIQYEADRLGVDLRVVHPVTLLHRACFGHD